ncbi:MAG: c-type cytochrome [Pseudomonadota bacterium]
MKKFIITALSAVAIISSSSLMAAGNAETGKTKAATCLACHGADGNSIAPNFPNLAAQGEAYMVKQLMDFKAGKRKDPTMNAMVLPLDEQTMQDIAAFYSTQKVKPGQADPKQVASGKQIYKGGIMETKIPACMGCHGPTGSGNPGATYPQLTSQKSAYVEKQLKDFRNAAQNPNQETAPVGRSNDPSALMRNAVKHLNDYEIKAVAQYIQGLQP